MTGEGTGKADPRTRLALRCWQFDRAAMAVQSVVHGPMRKRNWIADAMASPTGNWPHDEPLTAVCGKPPRKPKKDEPPHGAVPDPRCTCGIYATTDLEVINTYLGRPASVLGIVELGGRLIPASNGYRAAYARVAAILLVDEALTESWSLLRELAAAYKVPALVPVSAEAEDHRELIGLPTVGTEAEAWLRANGGAA